MTNITAAARIIAKVPNTGEDRTVSKEARLLVVAGCSIGVLLVAGCGGLVVGVKVGVEVKD